MVATAWRGLITWLMMSATMTSEIFVGSQVWVSLRRKYLEERVPRRINEQRLGEVIETPFETGSNPALYELQREIMTIIQVLTPSLSLRFFGFPKKQRRYLCLHCLSIRQKEYYFEYKNKEEFYLNSAVLVEPNSTCDQIYCVICGGKYRVTRLKCAEERCPSNVLDADNGLCLIHDTYIEEGIAIQQSI